jgi:hypothetical protein
MGSSPNPGRKYTRCEVGDLFTGLRDRVGDGGVVERGQVGADDDGGVEGDGDQREGQHGDQSRAQRLLQDGVQRVAAGVQGEDERAASDQQGRRHHDQHEVLDHVYPEEPGVVDRDDAHERGGDHGEAGVEGDRAQRRPRPGRVAPAYPNHAPRVQGSGGEQQHRHRNVEVPPGHHVGGRRRARCDGNDDHCW